MCPIQLCRLSLAHERACFRLPFWRPRKSHQFQPGLFEFVVLEIESARENHKRSEMQAIKPDMYEVELAPHGTVQLHRHEFDAVSIMMSNSEVIVRAPNKPDVRQKLSEGQMRLQSRGYVHSTSIEGDDIYRNVTVELLSPQDGGRNLCASVIAGEPLMARRMSCKHSLKLTKRE